MKRERTEHIETDSEQATEQAGRALAETLKQGDFVAFFGGLGMGKTAFIRGMASVLAPEAAVTSPTFALVNVYAGAVPLYHFDMYRVASFADLYSIGFFDYMDGQGILVTEWSENIEGILPEAAIRVFLRQGEDPSCRHIDIVYPGESERSWKEEVPS